MKRALVVVDDTDAHRTLLEEAGELAAGVDAELVLLSLITEEDLEEGVDTMESIADLEPFQVQESQVTDAAAEQVREIAAETFGDRDVSYRAIADVVEDENYADTIITVAEDNDCDHVFITGRRRSPTGKAIFGDTAQAVALNFEGPVTILTT